MGPGDAVAGGQGEPVTPLGVLNSWGDPEAVFTGERVGVGPGLVEGGQSSPPSSPGVTLLLRDSPREGGGGGKLPGPDSPAWKEGPA